VAGRVGAAPVKVPPPNPKASGGGAAALARKPGGKLTPSVRKTPGADVARGEDAFDYDLEEPVTGARKKKRTVPSENGAGAAAAAGDGDGDGDDVDDDDDDDAEHTRKQDGAPEPEYADALRALIPEFKPAVYVKHRGAKKFVRGHDADPNVPDGFVCVHEKVFAIADLAIAINKAIKLLDAKGIKDNGAQIMHYMFMPAKYKETNLKKTLDGVTKICNNYRVEKPNA
jgi:hypothetical protein